MKSLTRILPAGVSFPKRPGLPWLRQLLPSSPPSDPDVDAAARAQHAAVGLSRDSGRNRIVLAYDQLLGVAVVVIAGVLAGGGLIAQTELQAAVDGFQAGIV